MHTIADNEYIKLLNTEDALANGNYPASGGYIPVADFGRFCFEIHAGALADALVFQVKQDKGVTQTAAIKDITGATVSIAATGDDKTYIIDVPASELDIANGFTHVTLTLSGVSGSDYAAIIFRGYQARHLPVTQPTTFSSAVEL